MRLIVAMSGASGVQYGLRLIETLVELGHDVDLVVSNGARKVMGFEVNGDFTKILNMVSNSYDITDIGAKIASGTYRNDGMIIVPCSMKTLAAIANGFSENLIHRAADCMLKEERRLVIVLRETPYNLIHMKNMIRVNQAGGTILPASPGFYYNPTSIDDLINFIVGKILNVFSIHHQLFSPWDPDNVKK